MTGDQAYSDT